MNVPTRWWEALETWFMRRTAFLTHTRAPVVAAVLVPVLFGLMSVLAGQDDNWDLRNYHLYNVYALLNDRIGFDLAPGRFNTYFNPTLDLLPYWLTQWLPAPANGFVMGALHGLNFLLLLGIARQLTGASGSWRLPLLLAAACMMGPGFRGELGNSMGDNTTALLVLGSLYLILSRWEALGTRDARASATVLCAGMLMGLATGLKLTNGTYAVALCAAFVAVPLPWGRRLAMAVLFGVGVLAGMAITSGWWFVKMWEMFGNPLFPQFNNLFQSPWASQTAVIDTYFRPKTLLEYLQWPFIFARNFIRVSEVPMRLVMWPAVYLLFAVAGVALLVRRLRGAVPGSIGSRNTFFLLFFALAYLVWMHMFSIYRYLIPLELLVPLAIWLLWRTIASSRRSADRLAGVTLAVLLLSALPTPEWGHARWADRPYTADVPAFDQPAQSVVFIPQAEPPMAWLATMFPREVKFIGLGTGFPESPAWLGRVRQAAAERGGPHYVLLGTLKNEKLYTLQNKLAAAEWLGLTRDEAGCAKLDWLSRHVRLQALVRRLPAGGCTLELLPQHRQVDMATSNRAIVEAAAKHLESYGVGIDRASCQVYPAALGRRPYFYQLCRALPAMKPQ